ncbi:MAG: hypothetical protein EAZ51_07075 [Sphingobacteriales bacterium]|nr:MAG: hypothetical protein EAZ64_00940 [Sphingobacteriales bacterium]TAF79851.1 MAG: hypothetical protein EAZ51_07075 [Sphingobacteriales bacterium]
MPLWLVVAICFSPIILFLGWTNKFREKNPDIFAYILSLLGTFVGVVVGLYFNNLASLKDKQNRTIKVYQASRVEMEWLINRAKTLDILSDSVPVKKHQQFYNLELPPFYSQTLRSELISEISHPLSLEKFNLIRENLLFDVELLRQDNKLKNKAKLEEDLAEYRTQLNYSINAINLEIKRLNQEITNDDFENQSQVLLKKLMQ